MLNEQHRQIDISKKVEKTNLLKSDKQWKFSFKDAEAFEFGRTKRTCFPVVLYVCFSLNNY
jgi:hypothetical protein